MANKVEQTIKDIQFEQAKQFTESMMLNFGKSKDNSDNVEDKVVCKDGMSFLVKIK